MEPTQKSTLGSGDHHGELCRAPETNMDARQYRKVSQVDIQSENIENAKLQKERCLLGKDVLKCLEQHVFLHKRQEITHGSSVRNMR